MLFPKAPCHKAKTTGGVFMPVSLTAPGLFCLRGGTVMATPAGHPFLRGKGFGTTISDAKGLGDLNHSKWRATAGCAMAVITSTLRRAVERVMMLRYPRLAEIVHAMRSTVGGAGHGLMADRTLPNRGGITLCLDSAQVVIHLVAIGTGFVGVFGMGGVVTGFTL